MGHRVPPHLKGQGYSGPVAFRIAGMPYYTGDYLARTGVVVPSITSAYGHGTARLYSFLDLVTLRVVRELRKAHLSLQRVRRCVEVLHEQWDERLATARLLTDGKEVYLVRDEQKAIALLLQTGQVVWRACVDVGAAADDVRRLVAQEKSGKQSKVGRVNRRKAA